MPSLLEAIAVQSLPPAITVLSVHVPPESVDVQMFPPLTTAASFVPSLLEAMPRQFLGEGGCRNRSVQDSPESVDVHGLPPLATAAGFVPSLLEAIPSQFWPKEPTGLSVHVRPASADVHGLPPSFCARQHATAASFVPSLLEAMPYQLEIRPLPADVSVHVCPESGDVQTLPNATTAASFAPSALEVTRHQFRGGAPADLSVHEMPESQDVQMLPRSRPRSFRTAASFAPSALDVTDCHACAPGFTPRGQTGSGWQAVHSGLDVGGTSGAGVGAPTKRCAQTPHLPRPFRGFREHSHRAVDTSPHFFRSPRPCTAAHASGATAQPPAPPPHRQVADFLHARFLKGAHSSAVARAPPAASAPPASARAARSAPATAAAARGPRARAIPAPAPPPGSALARPPPPGPPLSRRPRPPRSPNSAFNLAMRRPAGRPGDVRG